MTTSWEEFESGVADCRACGLCSGASRKVPGEGDPHARVMFIGEGPGAEEDRQGRPFVGPAGALLTRMIEAIGLTREEVYIANIVKCRPPGNRVPTPEEAAACLPHLRRQVALVRPKVIVLLGSTAGRYTLSPDFRVTRDRGVWTQRKGVFMIATFHPSALLRDESYKPPAWQDFKTVREKLREIDNA